MRFSNAVLLNRSLFAALVLIAVYYIFVGHSVLPEPNRISLDVFHLTRSSDQVLELWGAPLSEQMSMGEYAICPKQSFWGIVEKEGIELSASWQQELLRADSEAAGLLHNLQPQQKISFVSDPAGLNYILIERDGEDIFIAQKQVRSLKTEQAQSTQPVRFDIKIQKSICHDLAAQKVPTAVINQLTAALGTRFNLAKEVYKGNRLQLLYGKSSQGPWQLYKFSFNNGKKKVRAYAYDFDGCQFVDDQGLVLKKAFLEKPVEPSYISSYFTVARKHPVLGVVRAHKGVDFAAVKGTPVRAAFAGKIVFVGVRGGYGNLIEIDHGQGIHTRYGHLDSYAKGMKKGSSVAQGQVIGAVGMTGLATGPHLHYEYLINGTAVDPLKAQKSPCKKLPSHDQIAFKKVQARYDDMEQGLPITVKN